MGRVICVIAAYNEATTIGQAVASAHTAGCDTVHVFDGGWDTFATGGSTDGTIARAGNAYLHQAAFQPETQEQKRTRMLQTCGATLGDHVLSLDADETLEGHLPDLEPGVHYNLTLQNEAPNDLPGIRGDFPHGDGGTTPFPLLRLFAWTPELACWWPGGFADEHGWIRPYTDDGASQLQIVQDVRIVHRAHERSPERIAAKAAFYARDAERRRLLPVGRGL